MHRSVSITFIHHKIIYMMVVEKCTRSHYRRFQKVKAFAICYIVFIQWSVSESFVYTPSNKTNLWIPRRRTHTQRNSAHIIYTFTRMALKLLPFQSLKYIIEHWRMLKLRFIKTIWNCIGKAFGRCNNVNLVRWNQTCSNHCTLCKSGKIKRTQKLPLIFIRNFVGLLDAGYVDDDFKNILI